MKAKVTVIRAKESELRNVIKTKGTVIKAKESDKS